ncbi:PepSY domain-containing protein [Nocardioides sp. R1-1]|uniref:PepSY domain-containing protein n=1 Tax=Nocardioides sp. R1-1 TaxID=3383502 RepID=UPI0038D1D92C
MKTTALRRKRVVIPAVAAVAVLAVGGTVWAASADDVSGDERTRVAAAAEKAAGGGKAVDVEKSDDPGEAYEVEVRRADGTEVDLTLDGDLAVVTREDDGDDDRDDRDERDDRDDRDDVDADDRALSAEERSSVERAALEAVGGGTVLETSASDDPGVAYEAEVRDAAGLEWNVDLDASFAVVAKSEDR